MYRAFLPGFGLLRGSEAYLSSNLAGQLLPPPGSSVVQYGYFRVGYSPDAARVAAFGSVPLPDDRPLLLPLVALLVLLRHRRRRRHDPPRGRPLAHRHRRGVRGRVVLPPPRVDGAVAGSEGAAPPLVDPRQAQARARPRRPEARKRISRAGARRPARGLVAWLRRRRREPLHHLPHSARVAPLRGVSTAQLSAPDAFAAFAIAFWAGAVVPITGSGLGVVDAVIMTMLIESSRPRTTHSSPPRSSGASSTRAHPPARRPCPRPFPPRRRPCRGRARPSLLNRAGYAPVLPAVT